MRLVANRSLRQLQALGQAYLVTVRETVVCLIFQHFFKRHLANYLGIFDLFLDWSWHDSSNLNLIPNNLVPIWEEFINARRETIEISAIEAEISMATKENQMSLCCQCHKGISTVETEVDRDKRQFCQDCQPIGKIQQSWRPLTGGRVSGIFVINEKRQVISRTGWQNSREYFSNDRKH